MPIDYKKYPPTWKSEIRPAILKRAKNKCEWCGVNNYAFLNRANGGQVELSQEEAQQVKADGGRVIRVVLTIAHINHDIQDNRHANLAALCQRCHLTHDAQHHAKNAAKTRRRKQTDAGQLELINYEPPRLATYGDLRALQGRGLG